jgi:VWFA-related protein
MQKKDCLTIVLAVIVVMVTAGGAAQVADQPQATFFAPVDVPLVSVDVYVFDGGGRPVPGLTRDDFELYEDGRQVEISHFFASPGITAGALDREKLSERGVDGGGPDQALYLVIYFDDTNLSRGRRQSAVEHLRAFLSAELPPDLRVMLVRYDGRIIVEQPFTEETDEVLVALDAIRGAASLSRQIDENVLIREIEMAASIAAVSGRMSQTLLENSGRTLWGSIESYVDQTVHRARTSIENQRRLIASLSGLSGRKAILLVTDGVESRPGEALYRTWSQVFGEIPEFRADAQRAFLQASRDDVSNDFEMSAAGVGYARTISAETRLLDEERLAVDQGMGAEVLMAHMAGTTGGRSLVNSPALAGQLEQVSEELGSYYSLAFEPQHLGDGKYHRLEVEVKANRFRVRHREGYMDIPLTERINDRTLAAAMHGIVDNPLGIAVATSGDIVKRDNGTYLVPVIVTVPIEQLVLVPAENEHQGKISIHLLVWDRRGDLSSPVHHEYPVSIPNASLIAALGQSAGYTLRLAVRPGWQRIAVGLRDEVSRTESVAILEVDVGGADGVDG